MLCSVLLIMVLSSLLPSVCACGVDVFRLYNYNYPPCYKLDHAYCKGDIVIVTTMNKRTPLEYQSLQYTLAMNCHY